MKKNSYILLIFTLLILGGIAFATLFAVITPRDSNSSVSAEKEYATVVNLTTSKDMISLPQPDTKGTMSLEEALLARRSIRNYSNQPLSAGEISQLLWSAQGITNEQGFRTAPSAGATFPLELFLMANNVTDISKGIYQYNPHNNSLNLLHEKDLAAEVSRASHSQSMIYEAGAVIIFGAVFERTTSRYGNRGERYVFNEVGHASQNVHLQAAALNLGTVVIGAFQDHEVEQILNLDDQIRILYMMPVGKIN